MVRGAPPSVEGDTVVHDQLFHLFVIVSVDGSLFIIEKNEDINVQPYEYDDNDDIFPDPFERPESITIIEILYNTKEFMGDEAFFTYDAFSWNCQNFVMSLLEGNGIHVSDEARSFILQDVSELAPMWAQRLAHGITSFYNRLKLAIAGEGARCRTKSP